MQYRHRPLYTFLALFVLLFFVLGVVHAFAASPVRINLCSGAGDGVYAGAADKIAEMARGDKTIEVHVIKDTGGTWGNIQRTVIGNADEGDYAAGEACNAMIGQPDGAVLLKRQNPSESANLIPIAELHKEYLHVLCSKESGITDLGSISSDPAKNGYSVALGDNGSGAWLVWQNIVAGDDAFSKVPIKNDDGVIALAAVASNQTTCLLVPAGLGNGTVAKADTAFGDGIVLASATNWSFNNAVDPQGKPLYEFTKIPGGTYPTALQSGWFGTSVKTIAWNAKVYVNKQRIPDNKALAAFITAVARARPAIIAAYGK